MSRGARHVAHSVQSHAVTVRPMLARMPCWFEHGNVCMMCSVCPPSTLQEMGVKKSELTKHKNDTEIEEPWVQCDNCQGWVHQICGLFNKGRNKEDVHYLCPDCLATGLECGQRQRIEVCAPCCWQHDIGQSTGKVDLMRTCRCGNAGVHGCWR